MQKLALALALSAFLPALPAVAVFDPPPGPSIAAAIDAARNAQRVARALATSGVLRGPGPDVLAECTFAETPRTTCEHPAVEPCRRALLEFYEVLAPTERSGFAEALADLARSAVIDATIRLSMGADPNLADACWNIAPAGAIPVETTADANATVLRVRPLLPLRAGRTWVLHVDGLEANTRAGTVVAPTSSQSDGRLRVEPGTLRKPFAERFSGAEDDFDRTLADTTLARLEQESALQDDFGGLASLQLTLPAPLTADELAGLRIYFAPPEPDRNDALARVRIGDPRKPLEALRSSLAQRPCAPLRLEPEREIVGLDPGAPGQPERILGGTYESLQLEIDQSPVANPVLVSLPTKWSASTPLVLLVSGHRGRAESMLAVHGPGLAQRGLAAAAIELPEHGRRDDTPADFVDMLDPGSVGRNMVQAAADVLAFVQVALTCGLEVEPGRLYEPSEVRYLGYSLGGMIGSMVRAVEPRLGTTVIVAPGAGIDQWLLLQVSHRLGLSFFSCSAGANQGKPCTGAADCPGAGSCLGNPFAFRLAGHLQPAYQWLLVSAEPGVFAAERTGGRASQAPLLLVAASEDVILSARLAVRLADAYGMRRRTSGGRRRGPNGRFVQWPGLGHELLQDERVRTQAWDFLASDGRVVRPVPARAP